MGTKLLVCGAAGRMGRSILSIAAGEDLFTIAGAVDAENHPDIGKDAGLLAGQSALGVNVTCEYPPGAGVVIDFSQPQAADTTIDYCLKNSAALVMGTTGLSAKQAEKIKSASKDIAIVYQSNMSLGMNVLFNLVGKVANMLGGDCDIEIVEQHHRFKKDSPSGSALTLAEKICDATGKDLPKDLVHGRSGKDALGKKDAIGIHAVRAGDIAGNHSVVFGTLGETVTLKHTAHSRDCFARGALAAAGWLASKESGLYSMADVLGIE